jgi:hypothetical protein
LKYRKYVDAHWFDGLNISQIGGLLHLKVEVLIQAQEVNLLSIPVEVRIKSTSANYPDNETMYGSYHRLVSWIIFWAVLSPGTQLWF